jgi:hypothetical protein
MQQMCMEFNLVTFEVDFVWTHRNLHCNDHLVVFSLVL